MLMNNEYIVTNNLTYTILIINHVYISELTDITQRNYAF